MLIEPLQIKDGYLQLSRAPGLGIELNTRVIEKYRLPDSSRIPDGSYSDMAFGKNYSQLTNAYQEVK